jgi:hypothetical protein
MKSATTRSAVRPTRAEGAQVRSSLVRLAAAERKLAHSARPWWQRAQRHRGALALCIGFSSGLALALLPLRWWLRVGTAYVACAASLPASPPPSRPTHSSSDAVA